MDALGRVRVVWILGQSEPGWVLAVQLPVTRAKSPRLTRRKSCGDATTSSMEVKEVCPRAYRHSLGTCKGGAAASTTTTGSPSVKSKDHHHHTVIGRNGNKEAPSERTNTKEMPKTSSSSHKMNEQRNGDVAVHS